MTIEQLNQKLAYINSRLSGVISDMYVSYDPKKLEKTANALQAEILGDPRIKKILTQGTPEQRKEYMDAIEKGAKSVREQLAALRDNDSMAANKAEISKITKGSNEQVFNVGYSVKDAEKTNFATVGSTAHNTRKKEIEDKKAIIDGLLKIEPKVSGAKGALVAAGKAGTTAEIIKEVKDLEKATQAYSEDVKKCRAVIGVNFKDLVDSVQNLVNDPGMDLSDEDVKKAITDLKRKCKEFDATSEIGGAASLGLSSTFVNVDFTNVSDVKNWINGLQNETNKPGNELLKDKDVLYDFIRGKIEDSHEKFNEKLEASTVINKLLTTEEIQKLTGDPEKSKSILTDLQKSLKEYQVRMEGPNAYNRKTLELLKEDLDKKSTAYTDVAMDKKALTIAGKTLSFESEMLDPNVSSNEYNQYLDFIDEQTTDKGVEFRQKFDQVVTTAMGRPRPTNKWYHKVGEWITFGKYKSPETKYDMEYYSQAVTVLKDAITEKKQRLDKANSVVGADTAEYRGKVIEQAVNKKEKVGTKAKSNIRKSLDAMER